MAKYVKRMTVKVKASMQHLHRRLEIRRMLIKQCHILISCINTQHTFQAAVYHIDCYFFDIHVFTVQYIAFFNLIQFPDRKSVADDFSQLRKLQ